jgi:hypothetical protein
MFFQSRSLVTVVSLAPQFLLWANMPQYEREGQIGSLRGDGPISRLMWRLCLGKKQKQSACFLCHWSYRNFLDWVAPTASLCAPISTAGWLHTCEWRCADISAQYLTWVVRQIWLTRDHTGVPGGFSVLHTLADIHIAWNIKLMLIVTETTSKYTCNECTHYCCGSF